MREYFESFIPVTKPADFSCCCFFIFQWLQDISKKIAALGVFEANMPNHVLINQYLPGQGIMVSFDIACGFYNVQLTKLEIR